MFRPVSRIFAIAGSLRSFVTIGMVHPNEQWRKVAGIRCPPDFTFPNNDIAIAYMKFPFQYNQYVNRINFAKENTINYGICSAFGFGSETSESKRRSEVLLRTNIEIIPQVDCNINTVSDPTKIICSRLSSSDVSYGDSGSPLVCYNTSDPKEVKRTGILVGVVSGTIPGFRSFFTKTSAHVNFIIREEPTREYIIKKLALKEYKDYEEYELTNIRTNVSNSRKWSLKLEVFIAILIIYEQKYYQII